MGAPQLQQRILNDVSVGTVHNFGLTYVAFVCCSPNIGLIETGASISMADILKLLGGVVVLVVFFWAAIKKSSRS